MPFLSNCPMGAICTQKLENFFLTLWRFMSCLPLLTDRESSLVIDKLFFECVTDFLIVAESAISKQFSLKQLRPLSVALSTFHFFSNLK